MDGGLLSLKWNNHKTTFFHVLSNIRKKEAYCDSTLACDGRFYPVHKLVLSTCSDYFEQMFEKTKDKQPVIVLKDIRHEELEALLNYMYLGEVNVLQNDLSGLIKAAECLRIKGLAVPDEDPNEKKDNKRSWEGDTSVSDGKRQRREERERLEERRQEERRQEERRERLEERREEKRREERKLEENRQEQRRQEERRQEERRQEERIQEDRLQEFSSSHKESSREPSRSDLGVVSSPSQSISTSRSPEPSRPSSNHNSNTSNDVPEQSLATTPMVVLDEEQPVVKEEPSEGYTIEDNDYTDGSVDTKEELQASFEAPNLVHDIAASLGYDHQQQAMRAGHPQSMEDLVAQVMPGSSGMQGKAWEGSNQSLVGLGYNEDYSEDGQRTAPMDASDLWERACLDSDGSCPYCGKVIRQRNDFKRHLRIHTGEKPFACPYCPYRATQSTNLKGHIIRKHQLSY